MSQFRKKPVVIEAEQYNGPVCVAKEAALPPTPVGVIWKHQDMTFDQYPFISTLEGDMAVRPGDWIITGVKGERYPCKPDIFAATYDAVVSQAGEGSKQAGGSVPGTKVGFDSPDHQPERASPAQPSAPSGVREAAQNVLKILRDNWMARMPEELQLALDALEAALASPEEKVHR